MDGIWEWLQGKKTYFAATLTAVLGVLQSDKVRELNLIPESWQGWLTLASMLAGLATVAAARSSQAKVEESLVDVANIQLRDLNEESAAEVLEATTRRLKSTAAKKPRKPKTKGKP